MEQFNQLTPAEHERLVLIAEECGEVIQIIGKILRHGYESYHPNDPIQLSNRSLLEKELGDLWHVIDRLCDAEDVRDNKIREHATIKAHKIKLYLHHQE